MFWAVVQLKTVVQQNRIKMKKQNRNALKQKRGFPVVSRHARNPLTEVGQELPGITREIRRMHRKRRRGFSEREAL